MSGHFQALARCWSAEGRARAEFTGFHFKIPLALTRTSAKSSIMVPSWSCSILSAHCPSSSFQIAETTLCSSLTYSGTPRD